MSDTYANVYDDGTIRIDRSEHGWHLQTLPAVTTLLVTENCKIVVIKEKKDSTGRWVVNCPGGMIEQGESSEAAAAREAEEETGLVPTKLTKFATVRTDFPDTYVDYYLGGNLRQGQKASWVIAGDEEIESAKEYSWNEVYEMALATEFHDPRLCVAVLQLARQPELLRDFGLLDGDGA